MNRLLSTIYLDLKLQFRNGFYYASAFIAIGLVILLRQFSHLDLNHFFAPIMFMNLEINAFYFIAGLVLLEKGEGTLESQVITPLRPFEYLISKAITLGILSVIETVVIVLFTIGISFNWFFLFIGCMFLVAIFSLYGFMVVVRYDSINEFLLPSILWTVGYLLPLLFYFDFFQTRLFYLHPLLAPLLLMQAAFEPITINHIIYGLLYSILWTAIALYFSLQAFDRFVISKQGHG